MIATTWPRAKGTKPKGTFAMESKVRRSHIWPCSFPSFEGQSRDNNMQITSRSRMAVRDLPLGVLEEIGLIQRRWTLVQMRLKQH
mmetsp:Transcript_67488/g.161960  ORF Transcript_67488/g.161960 Transcript_67488/m.161960 type:complete len:85 (+) Transcript_67488:658-912(+)